MWIWVHLSSKICAHWYVYLCPFMYKYVQLDERLGNELSLWFCHLLPPCPQNQKLQFQVNKVFHSKFILFSETFIVTHTSHHHTPGSGDHSCFFCLPVNIWHKNDLAILAFHPTEQPMLIACGLIVLGFIYLSSFSSLDVTWHKAQSGDLCSFCFFLKVLFTLVTLNIMTN